MAVVVLALEIHHSYAAINRARRYGQIPPLNLLSSYPHAEKSFALRAVVKSGAFVQLDMLPVEETAPHWLGVHPFQQRILLN